MSIDEVVDAIWPERRAGRRQAPPGHGPAPAALRLPLGAAAIVVRDQHGLRLAIPPRASRSDVARPARRRPRRPGGPPRGRPAYEADFGERQLAYEDWAMATREWCRARCSMLAGRVLDADLAGVEHGWTREAWPWPSTSAARGHRRRARPAGGATYVAGGARRGDALVADAGRAGVLTDPARAADRPRVAPGA